MDVFPQRRTGMNQEESDNLMSIIFDMADKNCDGYLNKTEYVVFRLLHSHSHQHFLNENDDT